jgi:hypothetical protein
VTTQSETRRGEEFLDGFDLAALHDKLDKIIAFQEKLEPHLPLLVKAAALFDNPASRFRDMTRRRKSHGDEDQAR